MAKKILLIIPAYNEEKNIIGVYKTILNFNQKNKLCYDVIVINDGSTDNTSKLLDQNNIPHIDLIQNLGIGGAVQTGYKYAKYNNYDIAVQFDGDGQHRVEYIKNIVAPIIAGEANMVIGSRFIDDTSQFKSTKSRRIGINLISKVISLKSGAKIKDVTSGFRAIDKNIIDLFCSDYPVEYPEPISSVKVINHKYIIKEVPVKMEKRQAGKSSITSWKSAYYMFNVIISILIMGKRIK